VDRHRECASEVAQHRRRLGAEHPPGAGEAEADGDGDGDGGGAERDPRQKHERRLHHLGEREPSGEAASEDAEDSGGEPEEQIFEAELTESEAGLPGALSPGRLTFSRRLQLSRKCLRDFYLAVGPIRPRWCASLID
jgi:hypothetical protein